MAKKHYNQRAQDNLSLNATVFNFIKTVKTECKRKTLVHGIRNQLLSLLKERHSLEQALINAQADTKGGVWAYLKRLAKVKELKASLSKINNTIVNWIDAISSHLVIRSPITAYSRA